MKIFNGNGNNYVSKEIYTYILVYQIGYGAY